MTAPTSLLKALLLVSLLTFMTSCEQEHRRKVLLQPYGDFDPTTLDSIGKSIERYYGFDVQIASAIELPNQAFIHVKSPRYRADSLLNIQQASKPDNIDFILGLTTSDISATKYDSQGNIRQPVSKYQDWGVFGLGRSPGCTSIVSTYRLKSNKDNQIVSRMKKVCNHELGHNLGLPHCTSGENCVMRDAAESIGTVDEVGEFLCNACKAKIR